MERLLYEAAAKRVTLVRACRRICQAISPSVGLSTLPASLIFVGVRVDIDKVQSTMEVGPSADDIEAAHMFRTFWGSEAELRRFPVGPSPCCSHTYCSSVLLLSSSHMLLSRDVTSGSGDPDDRGPQDGKVAETVTWNVPDGKTHLVLDSLASYVLGRHLPAGSSVKGFADSLDEVLTQQVAGSDDDAGFRCNLFSLQQWLA